MKRLRAGLMVGSLAAVMLPGIAAAQCEGGVSSAGFYLSNGAYVPGGCQYTNPTTTGQLHPSGAQVVPSTNPAAGVSRLPGQRVPAGLQPTILDTVTGSYGPLGPFNSTGAYTTTAGPGARPGAYPGAGLLPNTSTDIGATQNTLVDQLNPGNVSGNTSPAVTAPSTMGTVGAVPNAAAAIPETFDPVPAQPNVTGLSAGNTVSNPIDVPVGTGLPGNPYTNNGLNSISGLGNGMTSGPQVLLPATNTTIDGVTATSNVSNLGAPNVVTGTLNGTSSVLTPNGLGVLNVLPGVTNNNPSPAYSTTLPTAPAVDVTTVVNNPVRSNVPLPPGRGGPTWVGEELAPRVVVD